MFDETKEQSTNQGFSFNFILKRSNEVKACPLVAESPGGYFSYFFLCISQLLYFQYPNDMYDSYILLLPHLWIICVNKI